MTRGARLTKELQAATARAETDHLGALLRAYASALTQAGNLAADAFALTAAADWQPQPEGVILTDAELLALATTLQHRLNPIWTRIVLDIAKAPLARVEIAWDVKHPVAQSLLEQAGQRTGPRLGDAARFILRDTLAHAYETGLDVRETSALIRSVMTTSSSWQANMLARTDLNSLANGASKAAAQMTGMAYKVWDATLDAVTRPTHAEAHGQTVPIGDTFIVGGEDADYPGDPNLSDAEAANCRCTLVYGETLAEAGALTADGAAVIMDAMATKTQRRRRYERRAAHGKPLALVASSLATMPKGMGSMPAGVKACTTNGTPGYTGGGQCHMHDGTEAGMRKAMDRAKADAAKRSQNAVTAAAGAIRFTGIAAIEGQLSDDNTDMPRVILPRALSWDELPVPFMAQTKTAEGHDGAEVAGRIDTFRRHRGEGGTWTIEFEGELTTPFGINEIAPMIDDETLRGVSVDLGATEWQIVDRQTFKPVPESELSIEDMLAGSYALGAKSAKIRAATLVPVQALEGATVALAASAGQVQWNHVTLLAPADEGEALVASPAPKHPPRGWFETAEPPGKMPLTVTKEGRVYGHLALWDSCHTGFLPQCLPPPKSPSNYARFHVSRLDTEEGDEIWIGKLMFSPTDGGHADRHLSPQKASAHYDKSGMAAAYLRAVDGEYGIWVAGSLNPDLSDAQRAEMRRQLHLNPPSGDWRIWDGQHDLLCGLCVAVPGFPVGRTEVSIVASADGVEVIDAIIASSGHFDADPAAVAALEREGLVDDDLEAERRMRLLAVRAEGMDSLVALIQD